MRLWRGEPLVLASKSEIRRALLEAAGIPVTVDPADIDERALEAASLPKGPNAAALLLAREKALAVAHRRRGLVLGADQTLALGERRFSKPASAVAAREQLKSLSGNIHLLHSAVALARDGKIEYETVAVARLRMRSLPEAALDGYLAVAGAQATASVGGYQLEGLGVNLIEEIDGDHFTVLGLPLLPLLAHFRTAGLLP